MNCGGLVVWTWRLPSPGRWLLLLLLLICSSADHILFRGRHDADISAPI